MARLACQPASSPKARENAAKTLLHPVSLKYLEPHIAVGEMAALSEAFPEGHTRIWGVKFERLAQWVKLKVAPNDILVLFRSTNRVFFRGIVRHSLHSPSLACSLWGPDDDGQNWELLYFLSDPLEIDIPASIVSESAGRDAEWAWQGFTVLDPADSDAAIAVLLPQLQ